jgi:hypothetical protein
MAVAVALIVGKPLGIGGTLAMARATGFAALPEGTGAWHWLGAGMLGGIGFTMSLFLAALAFPDAPALVDSARVGILAGAGVGAGGGGGPVDRGRPPAGLGAYQLPVGMLTHGSAGGSVPSCNSSTLMPSGVFTKAMWPSRGGG